MRKKQIHIHELYEVTMVETWRRLRLHEDSDGRFIIDTDIFADYYPQNEGIYLCNDCGAEFTGAEAVEVLKTQN